METVAKPYPGRFVHGVNLGDWYPCWNLALAGRLWSPDFAMGGNPAGEYQRLRDTPIESLRICGFSQGALSPRAAAYVQVAAWIRREGYGGIGATEADRILRLGEIELAFEEARRRILPDGPSRLASLYLADDTEAGRAHVRAMLGPHILPVRMTIPLALRVCRADTRWFDLYCQDPKTEYLERYWSSAGTGTPAPTWEYLVDGTIEVDDPESLAHIRQFGAHRYIGEVGT